MNNSKLIVDETHQISNYSTKNDEINWDLIANETLAGSNETESTTTPPSSTSPYYITMEIISLSLMLVLLFYILLKPSQQGADVRQQRLERRLREKKLKSCPRRREKIVKSALYVKRVVRLDGVSLILGDIEDDGERSLGDDDGGGSSSWRSINDEDEDCSTCMICIEAFRVGDVVAWSRGLGKGQEGEEGADSIPCSHVFHEECIVPWLLNPKHDDCPSCRSCIVYDDYEEEEQQQEQQDNFVNNNNDGGGMSAGFVIVRGLVSRVRRASYSLIGQSIDLTDLDLDDDHDDDSHGDHDDDDEEQQRRNRFGPPPARGSLSRSSSLGDRIRRSVHGSLRRSFADFTTSASITHSDDDDDDGGGDGGDGCEDGEDGSKTNNSMLPPLSPSTKKKKKKALGRFSLPPKLPLRRVASAGPGGGGPSYRYHNINNHPDVEEGRASRRVRNRRQSRSSLLQRFEVPIEDSADADGDDHDDDGDHDDNDHENVKMRSTLVANEKKFSALRPSGVPFRRSLSSNTNGSIEDYDEDDDEEQQRSRDVVWTPVSSSRVD